MNCNFEYYQYIVKFNKILSNTTFSATVKTELPVVKATADL